MNHNIKRIFSVLMISFFLLVMLAMPAMAAGEFSVTRTVSNSEVCAGDTVRVTIVLTANQYMEAPAIQEEVPSGWEIEEVSDSGSYKEETTEWIWSSKMNQDDKKTIIYDLTVPDDAEAGTYDLSGSATAFEIDEISTTGDYQITVAGLVAEFRSNVTSGVAPLTVKFIDNSTDATSWQWDFDGDGDVDSTEQNPVYTYTSSGDYTVKLTVSDGDSSDSVTKSDYISVSSGSSSTTLDAAFTANDTSGQAPLSVKFTDISTGSITSWQWDFDGDGDVDSTEQNPVYTYTDNGTYTVKLSVSDGSDSDALTKTGYITVSDEGDDDDTLYEATAVSLSATIIADISIEVTPGAMNFGTLSAGEESSEHTLHIRNKGASDTKVTAQVTDVAKGLYEEGLMLNSGTWDGYSTVVESETTESVQTSLYVPDDFIAIGSMEGKLVFWAEAS